MKCTKAAKVKDMIGRQFFFSGQLRQALFAGSLAFIGIRARLARFFLLFGSLAFFGSFRFVRPRDICDGAGTQRAVPLHTIWEEESAVY